MEENKGFEKLSDFLNQSKNQVKPPAYQWQDLALTIIKDLAVPSFKRGSIFKACKENPKSEIIKAFNDTKELCKQGEKWKYFFKILADKDKK